MLFGRVAPRPVRPSDGADRPGGGYGSYWSYWSYWSEKLGSSLPMAAAVLFRPLWTLSWPARILV